MAPDHLACHRILSAEGCVQDAWVVGAKHKRVTCGQGGDHDRPLGCCPAVARQAQIASGGCCAGRGAVAVACRAACAAACLAVRNAPRRYRWGKRCSPSLRMARVRRLEVRHTSSGMPDLEREKGRCV